MEPSLHFFSVCMHNACMPSITIRDVPKKTHAELASRAAAAGQSLQEYLKSELSKIVERPDMHALMARLGDRKERFGTHLSTEEILRFRDEGRR